MEIVILIYQIIQEKFAYGELFMLVMIGYILMFKMVKKMQNSRLEIVARLTRSLNPKHNLQKQEKIHRKQDRRKQRMKVVESAENLVPLLSYWFYQKNMFLYKTRIRGSLMVLRAWK